MYARLVEPPRDPVCAAGPLGTSSVLRALSMQVWPAAPSGRPSAWPCPANRDSAGFSAVWPFQLGVSAVAGFGHQIPSLCRSKRITRESLPSSSGVPRFCSFLSLSPMNQCTHGLWSRLGTPRVPLVHLNSKGFRFFFDFLIRSYKDGVNRAHSLAKLAKSCT